MRTRLQLTVIVVLLVIALLSASPMAASGASGGVLTDADFAARYTSVVSIQTKAPYSGIQYAVGSQTMSATMPAADDTRFMKPPGTGLSRDCLGTLIAPDVVLTSSACADGIDDDAALGRPTSVVAGGPAWIAATSAPAASVAAVDHVRLHPSTYMRGDTFVGNVVNSSGTMASNTPAALAPPVFDIALVFLATPITSVRPAPLASSAATPSARGGVPVNTPATSVGRARDFWATPMLASGAGSAVATRTFRAPGIPSPGFVAPGTTSTLRAWNVMTANEEACESSTGPLREQAAAFDRRSMICGRYTTDPALARKQPWIACLDHTGAPLIARGADTVDRVLGVYSWQRAPGFRCSGLSAFTRIELVRDWIDAAVAAEHGAHAPLAAPAITSVRADGVRQLRVTWGVAPIGTPVRYTLLRQSPSFDVLAGIAVMRPVDVVVRSTALTTAPVVPCCSGGVGFDRLDTLASGGVASREALLRDIIPVKAGSREKLLLRVKVQDADGHVAIGPVFSTTPPVDRRPPTVPRTRVVPFQRTSLPAIMWSHSTDDDQLAGYLLQVRPAGARSWRYAGTRVTGQVSYAVPSTPPPVTWRSDVLEGTATRIFVPWQRRAGRYDVRVGAWDRAGNLAWSRARRIIVPARMLQPFADSVCRLAHGRVACQRTGSIPGYSIPPAATTPASAVRADARIGSFSAHTRSR